MGGGGQLAGAGGQRAPLQAAEMLRKRTGCSATMVTAKDQDAAGLKQK